MVSSPASAGRTYLGPLHSHDVLGLSEALIILSII